MQATGDAVQLLAKILLRYSSPSSARTIAVDTVCSWLATKFVKGCFEPKENGTSPLRGCAVYVIDHARAGAPMILRQDPLMQSGASAPSSHAVYGSSSRHTMQPTCEGAASTMLVRGKTKMSALGAAMRKLVHLSFGVLKTRQPYRADNTRAT